jgi:hypothetical protein
MHRSFKYIAVRTFGAVLPQIIQTGRATATAVLDQHKRRIVHAQYS